MPDYLAHKNTVETDQETSLIQAVRKYIQKTGDRSILAEKVQDIKVIDRLEMALDFLMNHRFNKQYGLIWGATTMDWGDVQPEHQWGVEMSQDSHPAIDIYDNAMFIMAIGDFLDLAGADYPKAGKWKAIESRLRTNVMKHLWDDERHKFTPHIYLDKGSPWPEDFDENRIYYHGGSTAAMQADLLSKEQIRLVLNDMVNNKQFAGAATIGITNWPAYPNGFFKNKSMVPYSYQNSGDWTWWGGRTIQELVRHGFAEEAYREILPMIERVRKNNGFYEWYTIANEPRGSGSFRGSAGTLGKAIIMLQKWARDNQG
jgi:glycogen debranching enzyme